MEGRRSFLGFYGAVITAVVREGPDVLVTFRNVRLERFLRGLRFTATVRFVDARRINSVDCDNTAIDCRLEPGWEVTWLTFDDLYADLTVCYTSRDIVIDVTHRIWCDAIQRKMTFAPIDTIRAYYFPSSFCRVSEEPAPSAPIEGQEGPMIH